MNSFILNVLASIIGGIILLFTASILSRRARWVLTGLLARLLNVDIEYVFNNKAEVFSDLKNEIARAHTVDILVSRGNELQRDTYASLFFNKPANKQVKIRILLPETKTKSGEYDWTSQRESELAKFDQAFGNGLLHRQIEAIALFLQPHLRAGQVELRRYNYPHIGRIVITERYAYYAPFRSNAHGRESNVYKFSRGGEMYDNLLRLFQQLWDAETQ